MDQPTIAWTFAIAVLGFALPGRLMAQSGEVTAVVNDAISAKPVVGASVSLEPSNDNTPFRTTLTNAAGRFLFVGVPPARYRIRIDNLAYGPLITDIFVVEPGSTRDLGSLALSIDAVQLDSLSVTAERPAVTFEADRTTYNVAAMLAAQGSTASELLRTIPELAVDLDGHVTMRGSRTAVYIDGRPAPMNGVALTAFLEQFPSEHIERIEVIDNPSARYAAEGPGGIVNIVLKAGVELGMTGIAFLRGGTRGQLGGGARATLQRGAWTLNGGSNIDRSNRETSSFRFRQNLLAEPLTILEQETGAKHNGASGNADIEVQYQAVERTRLWASSRLGLRSSNSDGTTITTEMDEARAPTAAYRRSNARNAGNLTTQFKAGFKHEWERRRHELSVEVTLDTSRDHDESDEGLDTPDPLNSAGHLPPTISMEEDRQSDKAFRLSIDYTRPWSESGRVELGYRLDAGRSHSDRKLRKMDDALSSSTSTTWDFEHQQSLNALYLTLQRQLGIVGLQVGLRGERSDLRFQVPAGDAFVNSDYRLFPSASLSARIDQNRQIRLSYSLRIGRPPPSVLNPIDQSTDPLNRQLGNPDIKPHKTHSFSLELNWSGPFGQLRLAPYYRRTEGMWAQITVVNREGVATRTWENVAFEEHYGATATAWLPNARTISGSVSLGATGDVRNSENLADTYSGSSFRWEARANFGVRITEQLSADGHFAYFPAIDLPQGRSDARISTGLGIRYRFLDRKASLDVSCQDPFELLGTSLETRDISHVQITRSSESSRSIRVSFSYALVGG